MSQWVPNPGSLTPSREGESQDSPLEGEKVSPAEDAGPRSPLSHHEGPANEVPTPEVPVKTPGWVRVSPFCLSALFFLSAFLMVFAPLPLLFFHFKRGRKWAWLAAAINSLWVGLFGGVVSLLFYLVWVVSLSLILPQLLLRKKSIEASVVYTLVAMAAVAFAGFSIYSQVHHLDLFQEIQKQVTVFIDYLGQSVSVNSGVINPADLEEWKHTFFLELPSALAIFSLVMVWANLALLLRANPNRIREHLGLESTYLKSWKAPQFLVWPTIVAGFFLIVDLGVASVIALNVFKLIMAIYAIQGLSILSYIFDLWGVRGFFRLAGYSLSLFLMMPLVLSLGFFDLWFDFRGKFRQTKE